MNEILFILLMVAGIAALGYLAMVLKSIHSILTNIDNTMEARSVEIDKVISDIPLLVESVQDLTDNVNSLVADVDSVLVSSENDITQIIKNVNGVVSDVNNITSLADELATDVYIGAENVKSTINSLTSGVSGFRSGPKLFRKKPSGLFDYFIIARDFAKDVKTILGS